MLLLSAKQQCNIAEKTLRRAKDALGIDVQKGGFQGSGCGAYPASALPIFRDPAKMVKQRWPKVVTKIPATINDHLWKKLKKSSKVVWPSLQVELAKDGHGIYMAMLWASMGEVSRSDRPCLTAKNAMSLHQMELSLIDCILQPPALGLFDIQFGMFEDSLAQILQADHLFGVPDGIRTRVTAVKGRGPGPLDDGDACC